MNNMDMGVPGSIFIDIYMRKGSSSLLPTQNRNARYVLLECTHFTEDTTEIEALLNDKLFFAI